MGKYKYLTYCMYFFPMKYPSYWKALLERRVPPMDSIAGDRDNGDGDEMTKTIKTTHEHPSHTPPSPPDLQAIDVVSFVHDTALL